MNHRNQTLLSAALRHVRDAEWLLERRDGYSSPDQAFHLAGYGPECARKATLSVDWFDKVIGHGLGGETVEALLSVAIALDPCADRYSIRDWKSSYPTLARWTEQSRYEETGTRLMDEVEALVREAREIVDGLFLSLWMDGRVSGEMV